MNIILASQSPRRKELLELMHIPFTVRVADIDETMDATRPYEEVARVSREKAQAAVRSDHELVIAADTIVVCDGQILGKPRTEEQAEQMLTLLSGRKHQVMTGLTVLQGAKCVCCTEVANVYFRPLSKREIAAYIRSKEPMDKAGAYGIQGGAAVFVERIEGDYYNIMGLPVCRLSTILKEFLEETP